MPRGLSQGVMGALHHTQPWKSAVSQSLLSTLTADPVPGEQGTEARPSQGKVGAWLGKQTHP